MLLAVRGAKMLRESGGGGDDARCEQRGIRRYGRCLSAIHVAARYACVITSATLVGRFPPVTPHAS